MPAEIGCRYFGPMWVAAAAMATGCGSSSQSESDAASRPDAALYSIALSDITGLSPDLADHPYGGGSSWGHSDKYAPGVALVDLDNDGILDLVQPRNDRSNPELRGLQMYRGLGDGRFEDVTPVTWDTARNATAVVAFDYDGDDDLDLFIGVDGGPSALYRNDGDWQLVDVAAEAGVELVDHRVFAAAAGDLDGDGHLDLYIGTWNASAPDHGPNTAPNVLLLNQGDGSFREGTDAAGVACEGRSTLGLALVDLDADGDLDIYVGNDFFRDCLYENRGDATFVDVAEAAGTSDSATGAMGVAIGDLDGDGLLDVMVTDTQAPDASRGNAVFINRGNLQFESRAIELGLDGIVTLSADWLVCWGVGLIDLDADGDLDVHVATHEQRSELVWRSEAGVFVPERALMASLEDVDGRGSAYGDIDGDHDIDMVVTRRGAPLQVLRNDGAGGRSLSVEIKPISRAPGARVTVDAGGRSQIVAVQAGDGYMSTNAPVAHFGLGETDSVDRIEVALVGGTRLCAGPIAVTGRHLAVVIDARDPRPCADAKDRLWR